MRMRDSLLHATGAAAELDEGSVLGRRRCQQRTRVGTTSKRNTADDRTGQAREDIGRHGIRWTPDDQGGGGAPHERNHPFPIEREIDSRGWRRDNCWHRTKSHGAEKGSDGLARVAHDQHHDVIGMEAGVA